MTGAGGEPAHPDPIGAVLDRVRRVRRRATQSRILLAVNRGVAAGTLLAAAAGGAAALFGVRPGPWLLFAGVPALAVAVHGLLRARPGLRSAALELDRAAGTKERFLSALGDGDPEVREMAARQAIAIARGVVVRRPPSGAGPAAALGVALLAGVLVLAPGAAGDDPLDGSGSPAGPSVVASGVPGTGENAARAPVETSGATAAVAKAARGEGLSEDDWRTLERLGTTEEEREAVRRALGEGDAASAARLLSEAVERARGPAGSATTGSQGVEAWAGYEAALARPVWSPRFDRVVREYFERASR